MRVILRLFKKRTSGTYPVQGVYSKLKEIFYSAIICISSWLFQKIVGAVSSDGDWGPKDPILQYEWKKCKMKEKETKRQEKVEEDKTEERRQRMRVNSKTELTRL